jgi:hypothetical protein
MNYLSEFRGSNMKYLIETGNWQNSARNDTVSHRNFSIFYDILLTFPLTENLFFGFVNIDS